MAVSTVNNNTTTTLPPASSSTSSGAMSSSDFMKVMLTQLAHQDPINPTDSNQLLTQMSQISQLQSNQDMQTNISSLTLQQSIGAAGNLIGKQVNGIATTGDSVTGNVTSVRVVDKNVYLELDSGQTLPMQNITSIADTSALAQAGTTSTAAGDPSSTAANQLLQLLQSLGGNTTAPAGA